MTVVRKFLFDNDFGAAARRSPGKAGQKTPGAARSAEAPGSSPSGRAMASYSEAEVQAAVEAARQQGEEAGQAKGRADANSRHDRQISQTLASLSGALGAIAKGHQQSADTTAQAIELGLAIARKLHPALATANGLAEIEATLAECLEALKKEPRLVAYVSPSLLDPMRERLEPMTQRAGFEGRVVLIGDATMNGTDCRIEWADGGVERDTAQTWREIETALDRCLEVRAAQESAAGDEDGR